MRRSLILLIAAASLLSGCLLVSCQERNHRDQIMVFAAASTMDAMSDVLQAFDSDNILVQVNYASSASLALLVSQGVPADLFLSANSEWADRAASSVSRSTRYNLLGNTLVLVAPVDSTLHVESLTELTNNSIRRIAIADPFSVPAGIYARQHLVRKRLWSDLESKLTAAGDVRKALAWVEQGAADAGFVYLTDVRNNNRVKVLLSIPELNDRIVYPLLRLHSVNRKLSVKSDATADRLVEFMRSEEGARIFARHGFRVFAQSEKATNNPGNQTGN